MSNHLQEIWVGIDVSKTQLDIAVGQVGETWNAGNDEVGIAKTVDRLETLPAGLVVVESTGGLEKALIRALQRAGIPFALVRPQEVDFALELCG